MIPLSKPPKVLKSTDTVGIFEIEALYTGYGVTIGNSLRRVLLTSLDGAAVTRVKIEGVSHEFSTIPGVLEDVLSVLLNLKQLRFRLHSDEPQKATLKVKGEREVTGSDFAFPAQVELVNPDILIAHLTAKTAALQMEIQIEKGVGYVPAAEGKKHKEEIGMISLDAIFTPVRKVSSKVENMRVGDRTDFNRLTLQIETDGSITPEEALYRAAEILVKQFGIVGETMKEMEESKRRILEAQTAKAKKPAEKKEESKAKKKTSKAAKPKKK